MPSIGAPYQHHLVSSIKLLSLRSTFAPSNQFAVSSMNLLCLWLNSCDLFCSLLAFDCDLSLPLVSSTYYALYQPLIVSEVSDSGAFAILFFGLISLALNYTADLQKENFKVVYRMFRNSRSINLSYVNVFSLLYNRFKDGHIWLNLVVDNSVHSNWAIKK